MSWGTADDLDRTAKILIEAGKAQDPTAAGRYLKGLILQIAVGPEIEYDLAAQAALATAVNAGRRAFHGGVHIHLQTDPVLRVGWTSGATASVIVTRCGGTLVGRLDPERPTLVIGRPNDRAGSPTLYCAWRGWAAGITQALDPALTQDGTVPAGILAAALGISETFQRELGNVLAGRRDVGISLWRPDFSLSALLDRYFSPHPSLC